LIARLAAEYVLGTLTGAARNRFEGLMQQREDVRAAVAEWDLALNRLAEHAPAVPPPPAAWEAISARITPLPRDESDRNWLETLAFWKRLAATASLVAVILAAVLFIPEPETPGLGGDYVVMMEDQSRQAIWVIDTANRVAELNVEKVAPMDMPAGKQCLLWLKDPDTGAMHVLGVLPDAGRTTIAIPRDLRQKLPGTLMVSIEDTAAVNPARPAQPLDIQSSWMMPLERSI
jgi:anti-sigma-K factor RskA